MSTVRQVVDVVKQFNIKPTWDMVASILEAIADGMKWQEAVWYVILVDQAEKTAELSGVNIGAVRKVMKARAQQLG